MKVLETNATRVLIFPQDTIPYNLLLRAERVKILVEAFGFQNHEIPFPVSETIAPRILTLKAGEITLDGRATTIEKVNFEDRKMLIKIKGSTSELNSVLRSFSAALEKILDGFSLESSKPLLESDRTESVTVLDIDFTAVFSKKFRKFIKKNLPHRTSHKVEMINPRRLSFELFFEQPLSYRSHKIAFTIEPRANTTIEDKVFFAASPCSSEIHFKILEEFEEAFRA
jgi:hypothetical protein